MPSLAIIKNLSAADSSYRVISGSDITPTCEAIKSPRLLVIAKPGICEFFNHTLCGPIKFPPFSIYGCILPPFDSILCFSAGTSGLWSFESGIAIHRLLSYLPIMALESPTFAQNRNLPRIMTRFTVVPEKLASIPRFWLRSVLAAENPIVRACSILV